ncbi:hypothetical protein O181_049474 [Austropuccinia psidii MF-1]|uniref:Methyltransferase domain-containing protein n=1 Tax=Austropuccinia psidii MF-1 TaxID=1389203 RepID=A0A9Q3DUZ4_9BASI|nr:hypothetical protein [Austropuccinia psidii MF-1]
MLECNCLPPSKLGTLTYWDESYEPEIVNLVDMGDEGEVWFAYDKDVLLIIQQSSPQQYQVGCGNGQLLFLLAQGGYPLELLAVIEYSASSIKLASQIVHSKGLDSLRLEQKDILMDQIPRPAHADDNNKLGWDLIMDKGTFDAISLSEATVDSQGLFEHYREKVMDLLVKVIEKRKSNERIMLGELS